MPVEQMQYSEKYFDDFYEYRHVILPPDLAALVPRNHLMTETEWRNLGVQQSPNWVHYMIHNPEPHVLLFRRPKSLDQPTETLNEVDPPVSMSVSITAHGKDKDRMLKAKFCQIPTPNRDHY